MLNEIIQNLYSAYLDARRHKRFTSNQLRFELNLESELLQLAHELETRTYEIQPSKCFICNHPVKREIVAPDFRDRVIHHLLFNWLEPIYERFLIYDCYSCRKGKGTHFGINRARGFMRAISDDYRRLAWVLKLDISGFFMSINRKKLFDMICDTLRRASYENITDRKLCLYLLEKVVFNDPLKNAEYKSPAAEWHGLPQNKSLKYSADGCGLPIGNVTSQLFGNVYLNPLDQFVKRKLHIKYYGRYVDDFFLMDCNRRELLLAKERIREFLQINLGLTLHPAKWQLQPVTHGFQFLGAFILPNRVYPNRRVESEFRMKVAQAHGLENLPPEVRQSYLGYFSHFDCYRKFCRVEL